MTIRKGEAWGRTIDRPDELTTVTDDAHLAAQLAAQRGSESPPALLAAGGDLARTLGGSAGRTQVNELPIDLLEVHLDGTDRPIASCAHVVMRAPWWRGGWFRGTIVLVMNAEFVGRWDVAPRGHPNDGRAEVFEAGPELSLRQRLAAWRRLPNASHLPHPAITTRSVERERWAFRRPMVVRIDGQGRGRATDVEVTVIPDAGIVHV